MLICKLIRPCVLAPRHPLFNMSRAWFSEQATTPEFLTNTKARAYYRNTISKINTRSSSGKGIFHQDILQRLAKKANKHDIPLLFEAYYNFLGHLTIISNKTMDNFILSIIHLAKKDSANIPFTTQKLLELLLHHDYLKYYPHYKVTQACAQFFVQHDPNHYNKFLDILQDKLLLKLDRQTIEILFGLSKDWIKFNRIIKIAVFRINNNILEGFGTNQLLAIIAEGILKFESLTICNHNPAMEQFLSGFQEPSIEQALCWVVMQGGLPKCAEVIKKLPEGDQKKVHLVNQTLLKIKEKGDSDMRGEMEGLLQKTPHAKIFQ